MINKIEIQEALKNGIVHSKNWTTNRIWTTEIKKILIQLAKDKYKVATSGVDAECYQERLWDVTWFNYENNETETGLQVALIAEIEWNPDFGEIKYDFEKLIMGRAELRLMIFPGDRESIKCLIEIVNSCRLSQFGDQYLFAAMSDSENFIFESYTYK